MNQAGPFARPLSGRVAVVTGAARGIGLAVARRLATAGANLVLVDRDLGGASEFDEELSAATVADALSTHGGRYIGVECELGDPSAVSDMTARAVDEFGRIDILVNVAGGMFYPVDVSSPSQVSAGDIKGVFNDNFTTMVNCVQAALPHMAEGGSIVNFASTAALVPNPGGGYSAYTSAKSAVIAFTRSLASEVGPRGIRANCVAPGLTMTARMIAQAGGRGLATADQLLQVPLRRFATPDDMARAVEFFASDLSSYVSGQCLSVCGGAVLTPS